MKLLLVTFGIYYHRLFVVILLVNIILLIILLGAIGDYYIVGYSIGGYWLLLMVIGSYSIGGY